MEGSVIFVKGYKPKLIEVELPLTRPMRLSVFGVGVEVVGVRG